MNITDGKFPRTDNDLSLKDYNFASYYNSVPPLNNDYSNISSLNNDISNLSLLNKDVSNVLLLHNYVLHIYVDMNVKNNSNTECNVKNLRVSKNFVVPQLFVMLKKY